MNERLQRTKTALGAVVIVGILIALVGLVGQLVVKLWCEVGWYWAVAVAAVFLCGAAWLGIDVFEEWQKKRQLGS